MHQPIWCSPPSPSLFLLPAGHLQYGAPPLTPPSSSSLQVTSKLIDYQRPPSKAKSLFNPGRDQGEGRVHDLMDARTTGSGGGPAGVQVSLCRGGQGLTAPYHPPLRGRAGLELRTFHPALPPC